MRLTCNNCGKVVSTEVPDNTIVRGWIDCPECIEKNDDFICKECGKKCKGFYPFGKGKKASELTRTDICESCEMKKYKNKKPSYEGLKKWHKSLIKTKVK
jgi:hypothetical protein